MNQKFKRSFVALAVASALSATAVRAVEQPIGEPFEINGMEVAAVYLQAVKMEPMMPGMDADKDVHIEADIHALKGNANGFGEGEWVPYLGITYELKKVGGTWTTAGHFHPMVAADGPHYGANVKLDGPGKYHVIYHISPPAYQGFYRHFDKETGVGQWWQPFSVEWGFTYVGTGKKGGY